MLSDGAYKRLVLFAIAWAFAGLCETSYRQKFYEKLCEITAGTGDAAFMPKCDEGLTIFEYVPDQDDKEKSWMAWARYQDVGVVFASQ